MKDNISAIILASGLSERMGVPKATLNWDKSTSFLEKIINEYVSFGCKRIVCMINVKIESFCRELKIDESVRFVINRHPEWGRLYSVKTSSKEVLESDYCFIQNIDNPFVSIETLEKLHSAKSPKAWCSPVYSGKGGHPVLLPKILIHKVYMEEDLQLTLLDILKPYKRINIEAESDSILRNINNPDDYRKYFPAQQLFSK